MPDSDLQLAYQGTTFRLRELDTGVVSELNDGAWSGYLLLACLDPIGDNQAFREALEILVRAGFAGRLIGDYAHHVKLMAINIRRQLTVQERVDYGEEVLALIRVTYMTMRDWAFGDVTLQAETYVVNRVLKRKTAAE